MKTIFILLSLTAVLAAKEQIAVIDFNAKGVDSLEALILTDRLGAELFKTDSFTLIEREMIREVLREQGFQKSGCTDESCMVEMGKLIGVRQIVGGSVSKLGSTFSIYARLIDVQTGTVLRSATYDHNGNIDDLLVQGIPFVARKLASGEPEKVNTVTKPASSDSQVVLSRVLLNPEPVSTPVQADPFTGFWPLQLSFIAPLQVVPSNFDIYGVSISILYSDNRMVMGVDAGVVNRIHTNLIGVQSGLINLTQGNYGLQAGAVNVSSMSGLMQAGVINVSRTAYGFQCGLVNVSDSMVGLQIGLINIIRRNRGLKFSPIVNVGLGSK